MTDRRNIVKERYDDLEDIQTTIRSYQDRNTIRETEKTRESIDKAASQLRENLAKKSKQSHVSHLQRCRKPVSLLVRRYVLGIDLIPIYYYSSAAGDRSVLTEVCLGHETK